MEYVIVAIVALVVFVLSFAVTRAFTMKAQKPLGKVIPIVVGNDGKDIAQRLSGAIRYRTIANNDPEKMDGQQFLDFHRYLKSCYPLAADRLRWETVRDYSLLITWKGKGGNKPVALLAHMDVVPVTPGTESDWEHEAFSGDVDGTFVWGRGALDMKGHLISLMEAVEGLLAQGYQPESDVYLCFGHNEELVSSPTSGARGIMEVLRDRGIRLETVIDEGGDILPGQQLLGIPGLVAVVGTAEKGYMDVSLSCAQAGGHSSQPPKTTALGILARALARVERKPLTPRLIGTVERMFMMAGRYMGFGKRLIFANLWLFRPLLLNTLAGNALTNAMVRTTFAATMAKGSPAANVLPQNAEIIANMRLLPGDTMQGAVEEIRKIVDDDRVKVSIVNGKEPSAESPLDTDGYRLIRETLEEMYPGILVLQYLMIGGTDSCLYEPICDNIYRISPFECDMDDLKRVHGTNERVSLINLARSAEFFRRVIVGLPK